MPQPCGSLPLEAYSMGGLDAWTDDRKYVADLFVPVRQFAQISQRFRRFLCGRKGSGKSAIAMKARCLSDWDVVHVIQGERRQYGAYMDLVESLAARPSLQINIKRFIQTLWDYVLRVVIMQVLVRYAKSLGLEDHPEAKKALAYLRKRGYYRRGIGNILHQAFEDAMTMLQPGASDPGPANAWLRLMADDEPVCEFENALPDLLGKKRLLIVLDTLESYEINSPAMKDGLRGIVTSIMELTGTEAYDNVGIRLFLPAEIYEDVIHDMPAKITASTVFLRWHYGDLLWLLTRRYLRLLRRTRLLPEQQIVDLDHMVRDCVERAGSGQVGRTLRERFWYGQNFLPRTILNVCRKEEDTFAYILRHSQRRPREVIAIANSLVATAYAQNVLPFMSRESVLEGLHRPSMLQLMLNETLCPYENYVDRIIDRARSVLALKPRVVTGLELKRFAGALYDLGPIDEMTPEGFVQYLLRAGLFGLVENTGEADADGPGYYTLCQFEYMMQGHVPFNNHLLYYAHPMLGDALRMTRSGEYGPAYPMPEEEWDLEGDIGLERPV